MRDETNPNNLDTHKVRVTGFSDQYAKTKSSSELTLPELRDRILATSAPIKSKLPWVKLASFGSKRSPPDPDTGKGGNSLRWDENVTAIEGVELDYDGKFIGGKAISFDEAVEIAKRMGCRCLIYTSPSHTLAAPRWRLLLPLLKSDQRLEIRKKYVARVNGFFGNIFAAESFKLSQSYYYGRALDNPDADHRADIIDGKFIDLQDELYRYEKDGTPKDEPDWENVGGQHNGRGFENILAELGDGPSLNGFHNVIRDAVASYVAAHKADLDKEELKTNIRNAIGKAPKNKTRKGPAFERYSTDKYLDDLIKSAKNKFAPSPANGPLPVIQIKHEVSGLANNATQAEQMLIDAGVEFFDRGGMLVRPITRDVAAATVNGQERRTKIAQLHQVDAVYMRDTLSRRIDWQRFDNAKDRKKWVSVNPPPEIAPTILSRRGEWLFPPIDGVITTPTMRADGSLLLNAGYDPATRLLLRAPPIMPPDFTEQPTRADALAAVKLLDDLLEEFRFADDGGVSNAAALSAIITPVVRGAFTVVPAHCAKAAIASSGKSYLFDVVAAIAIGQLMPVMAAGRNDEETEKRLGASLMVGQPLISIDNANGEIGGEALCQYIERPTFNIRVLGLSKNVTVEARGTSIFMTGNNITLNGDIVRRVITTSLDMREERPELHVFKKKPVAMVLANRGRYIAAALTICRAYVVAGRPFQINPLASFESWSDLVRSALLWLGKADCVQSLEAAHEENPQRVKLRSMLTAWVDAIGIGVLSDRTIGSAVRTAKETVGLSTPKYPDLLDAMKAVARVKGGYDDDAIDNNLAGKFLSQTKQLAMGWPYVTRDLILQ